MGRRMMVFVVALASPAPAAGQTHQEDIQTLQQGLFLAGPRVAGLPIVLVADRPDGVSAGAAAWISRDPSGRAQQVVIHTGSDVFRCASRWNSNRQCQLMLASIITHEAWHFRHGANEADAYAAQLAFLVFHRASSATVSGVALARRMVLAAESRRHSAAPSVTGDDEADSGVDVAVR